MNGTIRWRVVEEVVRHKEPALHAGLIGIVNPGECVRGDRVMLGRARVAGTDDNFEIW